MRRLFLISLLVGLLTNVQAQNEPPETVLKKIPDYRFNVSYAWRPSQPIQHLEIGLNKDLLNLKQDQIRLGLGVRAGIQDNNGVPFTTAHADLKKSDGNIDTLSLDRVQSFAFNFYANAEYYLMEKLSVGMNLDLLGFTAGQEFDGTFLPGSASRQAGHTSDNTVTAFPTSSNAYSSQNSKGSLNAQLFVRFEPFRRVGLRGGFSYLFQEFSTENGYGANEAYRFENNGLGFFIGVTFNRIEEK
ncbi:MAG: hypothetical protein JJ975_12815 [Bacteroidia bacterium]|nr:hypothetical protein [Bacteroidia bacterium]